MSFSRVVSVAALLPLLLLGGVYWFWRDLTTPSPLPPGGAAISVAPGESFRVTTDQLQAAGVIRHGWTLRLWARWQGADRLARSGDYRFDRALSPLQVLSKLRSPLAALHRITIPEGTTVHGVAELLAAAGFGGADVFLCRARDPRFLLALDLPASGLEGYLFPDTYAFAWSTPPEQILRTMVERFREQVRDLPAWPAAAVSEQQLVTLASLVEKETGAADERPMVSAVFRNRLQRGMPLQSDPTTVYGRADGRVPTHADIATESPYNTYLHPGLPPGPICNPGRAALKAALAPANAAYLYFVSRNDGTHEFSRTLEEHNRAVSRFQRGRP